MKAYSRFLTIPALCKELRAKRKEQRAKSEERPRNDALAYARAIAPNKCATLDRQIDGVVYELYELTPVEIAIVEGAREAT